MKGHLNDAFVLCGEKNLKIIEILSNTNEEM